MEGRFALFYGQHAKPQEDKKEHREVKKTKQTLQQIQEG